MKQLRCPHHVGRYFMLDAVQCYVPCNHLLIERACHSHQSILKFSRQVLLPVPLPLPVLFPPRCLVFVISPYPVVPVGIRPLSSSPPPFARCCYHLLPVFT